MPTNPNGAFSLLDYKKEEKRALAIKSREAAPRFGTPERQNLIDKIHEYMLSKAPPVPQISASQALEEHSTNKEVSDAINPQKSGSVSAEEELQVPGGDRIVEEPPVNVNPTPEPLRVPRQVLAGPSGEPLVQKPELRVHKPNDDRLFTWAAVGLTIAIVVLLLKKLMKASGHGALFMDGS